MARGKPPKTRLPWMAAVEALAALEQRDQAYALYRDYAQRFSAGEEPDIRFYLDLLHAGEADRFADMVDAFLCLADPPAPSQHDREKIAEFVAWIDSLPEEERSSCSAEEEERFQAYMREAE